MLHTTARSMLIALISVSLGLFVTLVAASASPALAASPMHLLPTVPA
ncbi:MAG: hypothetical protein ABR588_04905 [Sphingomicrobium sp.]|nr:hypothetical protein [Sphingomonadales bacterium]